MMSAATVATNICYLRWLLMQVVQANLIATALPDRCDRTIRTRLYYQVPANTFMYPIIDHSDLSTPLLL
jgi:hypothetical protein